MCKSAPAWGTICLARFLFVRSFVHSLNGESSSENRQVQVPFEGGQTSEKSSTRDNCCSSPWKVKFIEFDSQVEADYARSIGLEKAGVGYSACL